MRHIKTILISLIAAGMWGCLSDTSGIEPPTDKLIYPVGVATTSDNDHLLVVNSNFDLRYNAGTFVSLDLTRFENLGGPNEDYELSFDPETGIFTIIRGRLYDFCDPGQYLDYCHLDVSRSIDETETIFLGAYASDLKLTPSKDRAMIPVRGERSIVLVDVDDQGENLLDCGEGEDLTCDSAHKVTSNNKVTMPIEPYLVDSRDYTYENVTGETVTDTLGFVTHLAGGEVSLFSVSQRTGDNPPVKHNTLIDVIGGVIDGASGIAANPLKPDVYVSGRRDPAPHVAVLQVRTDIGDGGSYFNDPWFSQAATVSISSEIYGGTDARSVAVSPRGDEGYVLTQEPPALIKMDLTTYEVKDMTTVCQEPTKVKTYLDEGDPADPMDDTVYAFVLCFLTGQLFIVETEHMQTVVRTTGAGPQDITFDDKRKFAYIANFSDSTVSIFQAVPPFNQIRVKNPHDESDLKIVRIGEPKLP